MKRVAYTVFLSTLAPLAMFAPAAHAQWTVVNLHPAGATYSGAFGASGANQVGNAIVGGFGRASLWSGTAASWVDLHPAGSTWSQAFGASGANQVGNAAVGGIFRASLWSGTAASWVDLNPAGAAQSFVRGVSGANQVGNATVDGVTRASLWSGTAASWVDLNPAGATTSNALGASGTNQVGGAIVGGVLRAGVWSGTAASWVDLHPAGSVLSQAVGTSGANQVGRAIFIVNGIFHASLWSGTAASWVDLHPAGATSSEAWGVSGANQVGFATVGGIERASLWSGTAASWVDLHALLPAGFSSSQAMSITTDGVNNYIAGSGFNTATNRTEALLWTSPVTAPATLIDVTRTLGLHISGGVPELLASDDTYYILQSGPGFDPTEPHPARADFTFDSAGFAASTLDITLEEKANIGGPTAVVLLRNRVNSEWDELDRFSLSPADQTFEMTGIPASDYIGGGGNIKVRVRTFTVLILNPTIRGIFSHDFVGVLMRE